MATSRLDGLYATNLFLRGPLELMGEAATHIPDEVRAAYPEIPWRMIIATRNRLIHGYLGLDDDTLWSIIQDDVPALLPLLHGLKDETRP